ncbi:hypothetical protein D9611_007763 [Ephemerocybe angulata]|uniref:F-box domain-containing protein n=1 Tax=Ephemerocybe angulata TaxID=980116 RepID=A0A8H5CEG2_9AGAR|nr:hypothetical protein D9611_007763 [Tulosesus angulatus]
MLFQRSRAEPYAHLWVENDPPTDAEKGHIASALAKLEAELESLRPGERLSNDASKPRAGRHVNKRIPKLTDSIRRHRGLLSSVRSIPCEIWQAIFCFAMTNITTVGHRYGVALHALCRVSRLWNKAATMERSLWTVLPRVDSRRRQDTITVNAVSMYLERSGTLPLEIAYSGDVCVKPPPLDSSQPTDQVYVYSIFAVLLKVSHRWRQADFDIRDVDLSSLAVRGLTPILETLVLSIRPAVPEEDTGEPTDALILENFYNAPALRHVTVSTSGFASQTVILMHLKWPQLETFSSNSPRDLYYSKAVRYGRTSLRSLELTVNGMVIDPRVSLRLCPAASIVLPHLTKLVLHFGPNVSMSELAMRLPCLSLPALEELVVTGNVLDKMLASTLTVPLGTRIQSLKRLTLDENLKISSIDAGLGPLLTLARGLEHLDIQASPTLISQLRCQMPMPSDSAPRLPFPLLRILTLRSSVRDLTPDSNAESDQWFIAQQSMMANSIAIMLIQRTVDVGIYAIGLPDTPQVELREINFIHCDEGGSKAWRTQMMILDDRLCGTFVSGVPRLASKVVERFRSGLAALFLYSSSSQKGFDRATRWEMDFFMGEMEDLDLNRLDCRRLATRGVLHMLRQVGRTTKLAGYKQSKYDFQRRAKDLCMKWKPFLLRDARLALFRWTYVAENHMRLQYFATEPTTEKAWETIFGPPIM